MDSLIDKTVTPNPLEPTAGDVYARPKLPGESSRRIPRQVVIHEVWDDGDVEVIIDGSLESHTFDTYKGFRCFIASIPELVPVGRVFDPEAADEESSDA